MRTLALTFLLSVAPSFAADIYNFSLIPAGGNIQGTPGSAIGWGYTIENQSTALWLVTTGLSSGAFQHGSPSVIFDFPDVAPGETVTVAYDTALTGGLQQLLWDASAPIGFINSGIFILSAEWWDGDPLNSGSFQFGAPDQSASYGASVVTPEPATAAVAALALLAGGGLSALRRRSHTASN
jgi:hypothetical protein